MASIHKNILNQGSQNFMKLLAAKKVGYDVRQVQFSSLILTEQMSRHEELIT